MKTMTVIALAGIAAVAATARADAASQILLDATSIAGVNTVYFSGTGDYGAAFQRTSSADPLSARVTNTFGAGHIFDHQSGTIAENGGQEEYWISGDNYYYPGTSPAYITVDLGATYSLAGFQLFNTHNSGYNDRGTGDFQILGSNSVVVDGYNGLTLSGQIGTIASGTLAAENSAVPVLSPQVFGSDDFTGYRYIQFRALSANASGTAVANPQGGPSIAYGLNELRVFGTYLAPASPVPEPASWAMMVAGFGLLGGAMRRRPRNVLGIA